MKLPFIILKRSVYEGIETDLSKSRGKIAEQRIEIGRLVDDYNKLGREFDAFRKKNEPVKIQTTTKRALNNNGHAWRLIESRYYITNGHWVFKKSAIKNTVWPEIRNINWENYINNTDTQMRSVLPTEILSQNAFQPTGYVDEPNEKENIFIHNGEVAFDKRYYWLVTNKAGFRLLPSHGDIARSAWAIVRGKSEIVGALMPANPSNKDWKNEQ